MIRDPHEQLPSNSCARLRARSFSGTASTQEAPARSRQARAPFLSPTISQTRAAASRDLRPGTCAVILDRRLRNSPVPSGARIEQREMRPGIEILGKAPDLGRKRLLCRLLFAHSRQHVAPGRLETHHRRPALAERRRRAAAPPAPPRGSPPPPRSPRGAPGGPGPGFSRRSLRAPPPARAPGRPPRGRSGRAAARRPSRPRRARPRRDARAFSRSPLSRARSDRPARICGVPGCSRSARSRASSASRGRPDCRRTRVSSSHASSMRGFSAVSPRSSETASFSRWAATRCDASRIGRASGSGPSDRGGPSRPRRASATAR